MGRDIKSPGFHFKSWLRHLLAVCSAEYLPSPFLLFAALICAWGGWFMDFSNELPCHLASRWFWPLGGTSEKSDGGSKGSQDIDYSVSLLATLWCLATWFHRRPQPPLEGLFHIATLCWVPRTTLPTFPWSKACDRF